jgi:hypothetical protein
MNFSPTRYLSTFNTPAAAGAPASPPPAEVPPPAAAPPPPSPTVLQPIVVDMGQLQNARTVAQHNLAQVQQQQAAPPPATPPAEDPNAGIASELRALRKQVQDQNKLIVAAQLSEYRTRAIAAARAQGHGLIEPLVGGSSFAEIDASVGHSIAEYAVMRADILLAQQQATPPAAAGAPAASIPTPPVYAPTLPAAPVGYVGQAAPAAYPQGAISAPQVISAPSVPQPQVGPGGMPAQDLAYYTSAEAIRNGSYAQNRAAIMQALRGGAPNGLVQGGQVVPFQPQQLFAPPGGPIAQRPPAVQHQSIYDGVTAPRAASQGVLPTPPMGHGYPTAAGMQRAQQPSQLQFDDGSSNGVPVNAHAAREAALAAVQGLRRQ